MGVFKPDYAGIGRMLNSEAVLGKALLAAAEKVKAEAEATAPYDASHTDPQHFKTSFHAHLVTDHGEKGDRVVGQVYSDDPDGLPIEAGTSKTKPHNTLSNALDVLGGA